MRLQVADPACQRRAWCKRAVHLRPSLGLAGRDQVIAPQTRSDQKLPGAFAYSLFGPSRGMRRIVHAKTIRHGVQATIIPSKNACPAVISGEFRAKTNSGIPPNDPAGNESTRRLFDKEKNKKDSAADCPQEKDPQCPHSLPSEC